MKTGENQRTATRKYFVLSFNQYFGNIVESESFCYKKYQLRISSKNTLSSAESKNPWEKSQVILKIAISNPVPQLLVDHCSSLVHIN